MRLGLILPGLLLLLGSTTAFADTYPVSGEGGGISGTGSLTATSLGNGSWQITDISGTGVTGLVSTSPGYQNNDNLLMPNAATVLDDHGFAFTDLMGDTAYTVDLFASGAQQYAAWVKDSDGVEQEIAVDFTLEQQSVATMFRELAAEPAGTTRSFGYEFDQSVAATPEPTSVALLGTGFLGLAGMVKRRKR